MKKNNGYVLLETIVVITVLCIIMIMLYGSYTNILMKAQKKSYYDNTDYIYRTNLIRALLEDSLLETSYNTSIIHTVCSNYAAADSDKCYAPSLAHNFKNQFYDFLEVDAIYITKWNTNDFDLAVYSHLEPTSQNYIDYLDPIDISDDIYRIIVMYKKTNDDKSNHYATLRYGSRG